MVDVDGMRLIADLNSSISCGGLISLLNPAVIMWAMIIVYRLRRKIIRTVLCCIVHQLCTLMCRHVSSYVRWLLSLDFMDYLHLYHYWYQYTCLRISPLVYLCIFCILFFVCVFFCTVSSVLALAQSNWLCQNIWLKWSDVGHRLFTGMMSSVSCGFVLSAKKSEAEICSPASSIQSLRWG